MKKISIIAPIYNEENIVEEFFNRFKKVLNTISNYSFEFTIVNDGSIDNSLNKIEQIKSNYPFKIRVINLSRNFGHANALTAGLENTKSDIYILIDFDLEDPPELVPQLIKKFEEGHQVVYTVKTKREDSFIRKICFHGFHYFFSKVTNLKIPEGSGSFSLMSENFVNNLCKMGEANRFIPGLRAYVGYNPAYVSYIKEKRKGGNPKQTFLKLYRLSMNAFYMFSDITTTLSFFIFTVGIIHFFLKRTEPIATMLLAQQIIVMGLLNRIHQQVMRRPNYMIEKIYE